MANRKRKPSTAPAAAAPVVNPLIGRVLDGRYRIDEQLGAGGVGAVYFGTQIALGRPVAIKILHEGVHPSFTQRFEREARALASLRHPNIVAVTDFGVCDGTPFLVMELLEGETLAYRLMKGRLQPDPVLELARQLLRALAFVHEQGLVHRDLKPGNVFLEKLPGGEERLKLLDFGLAKFVLANANPDEPAVTRAGDIVGTPAYIAPEQVAGDTVDARADTYAMGIMLFQMLAGRVPFEGEPVEQLKSHLVAPVPKLHEKQPGLYARPELESFFQRAMAKAREARFQNCGEMLAALEAIPRPWVKQVDMKIEPGLASTMLSTPPPDASLDARTQLHEPGPSDTQLVRYARRYGTLALAVISLTAMALVAALLTHDRRAARQAAAAATAGQPESEPSGEPPPTITAGDDGRHSSARIAPTSPASPTPTTVPSPPATDPSPALPPSPAPSPAPAPSLAPSASPAPAPPSSAASSASAPPAAGPPPSRPSRAPSRSRRNRSARQPVTPGRAALPRSCARCAAPPSPESAPTTARSRSSASTTATTRATHAATCCSRTST